MVKLSNLLNLIQNENMKIYRRPRTWVMMGLVVLIPLVIAIILKSVNSDEPIVSNMLSFMNMASNLTVVVFVFSIVIAAEIVAGEFTWGTIKLLLIRPATRSKILLSKYFASILFMLLMLAILYIFSALIGLLFFGNSGDANDLSLLSILEKYGFATIDLFMSLTFAFMISSIFRSSVLAIALSFILMFFSGTIMQVLKAFGYKWAKYILFANTDLSLYTKGREPFMEGMTLGFSLTMLLIYYIVFVGLAWTLFKKRDVAG
ncbi:ABC transporter permease [Paenibacillus koleovorans]|uniref:ABC transporter permease n=1 Tax=Paenibacillus koleovorans TaxID=121608 RepID=UPI001FE738B6|nr:ABC transporter permease [Paenibacillus koleovorans]